MLTIGEAARLLGTTPRTLRFYHERGVVPEPGRDAQGYRRYDIGTLHALRRVLGFRDLGLPLDRCAALLDAAHEDLGTALREWEEEIVRRQRELERRRSTIARLRAEHDRAPGTGEHQAAWARVLTEHGVSPDLIAREAAAARLLSLLSERDPLQGPAPSYGPDPDRDGADVGAVMARFSEFPHAGLGTEAADRLVGDLVALALPVLSAVPVPADSDSGAADTLASDLLAAFPPVQRRLLREVVRRLGAQSGSGASPDASPEPDLP